MTARLYLTPLESTPRAAEPGTGPVVSGVEGRAARGDPRRSLPEGSASRRAVIAIFVTATLSGLMALGLGWLAAGLF